MNAQELSTPFLSETARLQSFQNWPVPHIVAPEDLAKAGFYYMKQDDKAKCVFCRGIIEKWELGDHPDREHKRHFPFCPFVQTVIQPRLERLQPEEVNLGPNVSYDAQNQSQDELGINLHKGPYQSDYVTLEARLNTFKTWPKALAQTPKMLAEAGFFYQGYGDRVQCFSCGGGFRDWDPQDDPWTEHAKWFSKCNYVQLVKGSDFVRKCRSGALANSSNGMIIGNGPADPKGSQMKLEISSERAKPQEASIANSPSSSTSLESLPAEEINRLVKESRLCKICMIEEVGVVFLPCGHLAVCVSCASNLKTCPICRSSIKGTVRTFLS